MLTCRPYRVAAGVLIVAAASSACFSLDDPMSLSGADVLEVNIVPDTAIANGASRVPVIARLVGDTPTGTELTFTTDAGSFVGAPAATPRELKVKSSSRTVEAILLAGIDAAVATVTVSAGGFSVRDTVRLRPAPPEDVELTTDVSRAEANGQSAINLTARLLRLLSEERVSRGTRVQFEVSMNGAAVPELSASAETDTLGVARRQLVTRVPGTYQVIASASGLADTVSVEFTAP